MKKSAKIFIVLCVILLDLIWAAWPRLYMHGRILDEPYRNTERREALYAWKQHPTPETKSAYDGEVGLLDRHELAIPIGILAFEVVGIYLFWKFVPTKTTP